MHFFLVDYFMFVVELAVFICSSNSEYFDHFSYGLFGWREEGGGVEGSRVVWAKNNLILY